MAMVQAYRSRNHDRIMAAAAAAALQLLIGYVLITGLAAQVAQNTGSGLKVFDVSEPLPPPPEEEAPADLASQEKEGAAAPPNLKAKPSPVIAPPPRVRLEVSPPVVAAPIATMQGPDRSAGASLVAGPGTGSGGVGTGTGSGAEGSGGGSGAWKAVRISGALRNEDYPRSALRAGAEGTVSVRFTVRADGRVSGCRIAKSSGHADLDGTTCKLIERRFRYKPARNRSGKPVASSAGTSFEWYLPFKTRALPQ